MWERHVHAPIPDDASLLIDVGCGTGAVTVSLGQDYPSAKVVGVDLSAMPLTTIAPPNVEFVQGDIRELVGKEPRLQPGTADLVYSRLLVLGMKSSDWPDHVKALASLVKPGGYLELTEVEQGCHECSDFKDIAGTRRPVYAEWNDAWRKSCREAYGTDPEVGNRLRRYMQDAGLVDMHERVYPWANGRWIEEYMTQAAALGKIDQSQPIGLVFRNMMGNMFSAENIAEYVEIAEAWFRGNPSGQFAVLHAVTGRKPDVPEEVARSKGG